MNDYPLMVLHIEGTSIEELRAQAIRALDLRIASHTTAMNVVDGLQAEAQKAASFNQKHPDKGDFGQVDNANGVEVSPEGEPEEPTPTAAPAKKQRAARKPKAEPANDAEPATPLTVDSVRSAFDEYVKMFGAAAAMTDGPVLMSRVFGNGIQRIKDIPEDDTAKIGRIIAAVQGAMLTNEFSRPAVSEKVQ